MQHLSSIPSKGSVSEKHAVRSSSCCTMTDLCVGFCEMLISMKTGRTRYISATVTFWHFLILEGHNTFHNLLLCIFVSLFHYMMHNNWLKELLKHFNSIHITSIKPWSANVTKCSHILRQKSSWHYSHSHLFIVITIINFVGSASCNCLYSSSEPFIWIIYTNFMII